MDTTAPGPGTNAGELPSGTDVAVRIRGLSKVYGGVAAVDGVDFDIDRGETFALLGPNGAGKSTTIEILEGYRHRTGGEVQRARRRPRPRRPRLEGAARHRAAVGGRDRACAPCASSCAHFAGFYPNPRDVDEVIAAVGLEAKAKHPHRASSSGGQRRRVDVALGIIGRPELLFLDEPTTGFDPEARREFWKLIRSLKAEGTTILLTTHYLDEAAQLGDRAGVIAGGRLVDVGARRRDRRRGGARAHRALAGARRHARARSAPSDRPSSWHPSSPQHGGEPDALEVIRPSLEDIYLRLVHAAGADAHDDEEALA